MGRADAHGAAVRASAAKGETLKGPCWTVPVEAVRSSANRIGREILAALTRRHVTFGPHVEVERMPKGFVASVTYEDPAYPGRRQAQPITLDWAPQENAA